MVDEARAVDSPWSWEPLVGLGPVRFGDRIESLRKFMTIECEETRVDNDGEWRWYAVRDAGVSLHTLNGVVISASLIKSWSRWLRILVMVWGSAARSS